MGKKLKPKKEVLMHQHKDERGNKFGHIHPVEEIHQKKKTKLYHDLTINEESSK